MNGLVGWAPTFISRELSLTPAQSSLILGTWGLAFGIAGTVAGGLVADWLRPRVRGAKLVTTALGFFIGSPLLIWLLFIRDLSLFIPDFCAAFFFLSWYNGPLTAVMFDVTPSRIATTVSGAYLRFIHLAGDAVAFPLVGFLSDRFGLEYAIIMLPIAALIGAAIILSAVRSIDTDVQMVAMPTSELKAVRLPGRPPGV
jgi:sugar phosphate permease